MASPDARRRAIRKASKQTSTGSVWVRRAAVGRTAVRSAKAGRSVRKKTKP
jgi:hypothetical protein